MNKIYKMKYKNRNQKSKMKIDSSKLLNYLKKKKHFKKSYNRKLYKNSYK